MNNNFHWLSSDQSVLILTVPEYWKWDEMHDWVTEIVTILDTYTEPIAVVFNFQHSTFVPQNAIPKFQPIVTHLHPMVEAIIFAHISPSHQAVLDMVFQLYPQGADKLLILDRLEDAIGVE